MRLNDNNIKAATELKQLFDDNPVAKEIIRAFVNLFVQEAIGSIGGSRKDIDRAALLIDIDSRVRCLKDIDRAILDIDRLCAEYEDKHKSSPSEGDQA